MIVMKEWLSNWRRLDSVVGGVVDTREWTCLEAGDDWASKYGYIYVGDSLLLITLNMWTIQPQHVFLIDILDNKREGSKVVKAIVQKLENMPLLKELQK